MNPISNHKGFTLIELMIVVVIVGILSSIALPSYQQYVRKANRADGMSAIQMILDAQERYYADHIKYTTTLSDLGVTFSPPEGHYKITAPACGRHGREGIELRASAQARSMKEGT